MKHAVKILGTFFLIFALVSGVLFFGFDWFRGVPARAATLQYVGGTSCTGTSATYNCSLTSLAGGIGSSAATGDLVIVVTGWASTANDDPGVVTSGYTEEYDLRANDVRDANVSVNWKIMGISPDALVTVSGSGSGSNGGATVVHVWRGADQTTPMDVTPPTGDTSNNSARPNSPSITPVTTGAYVLTVGLGTGDTTPSAFTAPTGYGNAVSVSGAGSTMSAIAVIASRAWTSGVENPGAWTGGESTNQDSWAAGTLAIRPGNTPPTLSISEPDGTSDTIAENESYNITYTLADTDNVITAAFYYDANNSGLDGVAISGGCASAAEGAGVMCSWNTTGVTPGSYYVYGITSDGVNPQVSAYSSGVVTINARPTLSISQPDGTGDTVTQGDSFNVTYSLADSDNVVTAAFYYDTNAAGLDGTAITGACATAAEGTGATCSWNTTGVTPGSYYVYGTTSDGTNPAVSAYSGGTITINAPANSPPTLSIAQPDGVSDTVTQGDSFNVTYSLADSDNVVTAAFYYDTNAAGLDGTAITGACATAAEGTGATCSWNTTGVTPGSYYVYGTTSDGTNPAVSAYSGGTITINAPAVISVDSITPNSGALAGGTSVTISGSNFQSGATITFDSISATDIVFVNSSTLTAKTPAHAAGMVDVVVTNPDLASDTLVSGFTYTAAAVVTLNASPLTLISGESFVMNWSTQNATSCSASGAWSGSKATSGNETITPTSTGTHMYTLECTGTGGSGSDSVSVVVNVGGALKEPGTLFRFDGFAYPEGKIFLYDNSAPFSQLLNDVSGRFATSFRLMSLDDKHVFSVIAYDKEGNASPSKTFPSDLYAQGGLTDILIAPTIVLNKRAFGNNEIVRISGYATPGNKVQVEIDGRIVGTVPTVASGYYTISAPLSLLARGSHVARAMQVTARAQTSDYSLLKTFQISDPFTVHADLNNDGKLTISDWSIFLSSWGSREDAVRKKIDFNNDGRITIFDLSVFLSSFKKK